jgi:two-component system phosphate regulon sensor histidine kinase PhoR
MNGEIDTMAQLVQELLELTRIESGRAPLQKVNLNPGEILQAAAERMRLQADRAGLAMNVITPAGLPSVKVDRGRIEQVLVNILHNAVKFTPAGGRIQAEVQGSDGGVIFSIRDTGPGIPEEDLERIFERFYKRDKARSGGGTGLGLSVAKRIVEAHGGRIWAESQPGAGSVFYFYIPS